MSNSVLATGTESLSMLCMAGRHAEGCSICTLRGKEAADETPS